MRLAAVGDGLIGPLLDHRRAQSGLSRAWRDHRPLAWLRVIGPQFSLAEEDVWGAPGAASPAIADRVAAMLAGVQGLDAMLICAGEEDARAAIRGVAPPPDDTVAALEQIATSCLAAGVTPIFILPPPSALFANGLYADRYIAVGATLRRLRGRDARIALVDANAALRKPRAFGVEPAPHYVSADAEGGLNPLGAFRLAQEIAVQLGKLCPRAKRRALDENLQTVLNVNPLLRGSCGDIGSGLDGACADGYGLDAHQPGGARIAASTGGGGQRLRINGRYSTPWGFFRLRQTVADDGVRAIAPGDEIEALCDFDLRGPVENLASVSLHATAAWDRDFIGLHSRNYIGGPGVAEPHEGRLRTPPFTLPAPLKALHVSLQIHLAPGVDLKAHGDLRIGAIVVRKIDSEKAKKENFRDNPPADFSGLPARLRSRSHA